MRGRSLLALTDSYVEREWDSRPAFGMWQNQVFTVRTPRWRFVWNKDGVEPDDPPAGRYPIPVEALYDVERDPMELHDVSAEHPEVVQELKDAIVEWLASQVACGDRGRIASEAYSAALGDLGYADPGSPEHPNSGDPDPGAPDPGDPDPGNPDGD